MKQLGYNPKFRVSGIEGKTEEVGKKEVGGKKKKVGRKESRRSSTVQTLFTYQNTSSLDLDLPADAWRDIGLGSVVQQSGSIGDSENRYILTSQSEEGGTCVSAPSRVRKCEVCMVTDSVCEFLRAMIKVTLTLTLTPNPNS
jgi:hypothetical protein